MIQGRYQDVKHKMYEHLQVSEKEAEKSMSAPEHDYQEQVSPHI